jgi:hypothetical protein
MIAACMPVDRSLIPPLLPAMIRDRLPAADFTEDGCTECTAPVLVPPGVRVLQLLGLSRPVCYGCTLALV